MGESTIVWYAPLKRASGGFRGKTHSAARWDRDSILKKVMPAVGHRGNRLMTPGPVQSPSLWTTWDPKPKFNNPVLNRTWPEYKRKKRRHPAKPNRLEAENYIAVRGKDGEGGKGLLRAALFCSSKVVGQAVFAASEWSHSIDGIAYGNVDGQRCRVFLSIRPKHLDDLHASLKVECRDDFQLSVTPAQRNKNWAYYPKNPPEAGAGDQVVAVSAKADLFSDVCSEILQGQMEGDYEFWAEEFEKACGHAQRGESRDLLHLLRQMGVACLAWQREKDGSTILHCACKTGQLDVAMDILEFGKKNGVVGNAQVEKMLMMKDGNGDAPKDVAKKVAERIGRTLWQSSTRSLQLRWIGVPFSRRPRMAVSSGCNICWLTVRMP